jgi:xylan 1,4-beta-xylosidase
MADFKLVNAHHAPMGAFASFTLGFPGASGGFDLERAQPPCEAVFVGLESAADENVFHTLPFADKPTHDESARFSSAHSEVQEISARIRYEDFADAQITREFGIATDTWRAGDLRFTLISPALSAPDPDSADEATLKAALVPAIYAEIEVDNRAGTRARRVAFGYAGNDPYRGMRHISGEGFVGVGQGREVALLTNAPGAWSGIGFEPALILGDTHPENRIWGLGGCGLLVAEVPAGRVTTLRYAVAFHRAGIVTTGLDTRYFYTRWFRDVESAGAFALARFDAARAEAAAHEARLAASSLSQPQRLMLAHATRAYVGCTQLLEHEGRPLWVVNEGEYRMMNTFDLTVDHLFHELALHPWAVRNVLDLYCERYSFHDKVALPGQPASDAGGLSFTHDMGVANAFSPLGNSSYERGGLSGCFSHMTQEQLTNWVLCAGVYIESQRDTAWLRKHAATLAACFESLIARDHPDAAQRDGVMHADSDRCLGGAEITTYDSLDTSLGQARANTYLAGKCWASYLILERLFTQLGDAPRAAHAASQARRCADTLVAAVAPDGTLPALLEPSSAGFSSRIIPAIEGLAYPWFAGRRDACQPDGPYGAYVKVLARHLNAVLKPGVCLFPDGSWKLSSSSDNSWLSKIYLCQFVAREILALPASETAVSDEAHAAWLSDPRNAFWSWSDQIEAGEAIGSKYYPRGVTATLWLGEAAR